MNFILNKDENNENKNNFVVGNNSFLRFFNTPIIKRFNINKKIIPFCSLESSFIPKDFIKFKFYTGISLKIIKNIFFDFSLCSKNNYNNNIDNLKKKLFIFSILN